MVKRMLIDSTHPEEIRVVVLNGNRLEEFDFETSTKKQIKGNIYLAKVTRVEPSLQAAFVEYGGNRHGFLAFSEIHPDYYRIPVSDRDYGHGRNGLRTGDPYSDHHDDHEDPDMADIDSAESDRDLEEEHRLPPGYSNTEESHGNDVHSSGVSEAESDEPEDDRHETDGPSAALFSPEEAHSESADDQDSPAEPWLTGSISEPTREIPTANDPAPKPDDESAPKNTVAEARIETPTLRGDAEPETGHYDDFPEGERSFEEPAERPVTEEPNIEQQAAETAAYGEPNAPVYNPDLPSLAVEPAEHAPGAEIPAKITEHVTPPDAHPEQTGGDSVEVFGGDEIEEASRQRARRYRPYKIQEVIKRRQIMLVQVTKEERGNKGAALTTYMSLAGRYCVLMPNTDRSGGVSRKITNAADRKRLKELVDDLHVPDGMGVIVRTAGSERSKPEIRRDFEYLFRLWDEIREKTLKSTAPTLIYEEGDLIKRSIRDLYSRDIEEVIVEGEEGYKAARSFMKMLMPSHAKRVHHYRDASIPLFQRYQVETQIDAIHSPIVQLRSGGYIVINPTEALVSIDVNSGRATRERNIEETALKTNCEAADEIARQLRLRDLAGLIVIDFIDMEEHRNQVTVERRLKEALKHDRARIQVGRISAFGLLEMSRQRLRPSLVEASTQPCPHCGGTGHIRSVESAALHVLRAIEEEGMRRRSAEIAVAMATNVGLYILNQKRAMLIEIEQRYHFRVAITGDDSLIPPEHRLERVRALTASELASLPPPVAQDPSFDDEEEEDREPQTVEDDDYQYEEIAEIGGVPTELISAIESAEPSETAAHLAEEPAHTATGHDESRPESHGRKRRRRRRRRGVDEQHEGGAKRSEPRAEHAFVEAHEISAEEISGGESYYNASAEDSAPREDALGDRSGQAESWPDESADGNGRKRRRRGRRGGKRRRRGGDEGQGPIETTAGTVIYDETGRLPGENLGQEEFGDEELGLDTPGIADHQHEREAHEDRSHEDHGKDQSLGNDIPELRLGSEAGSNGHDEVAHEVRDASSPDASELAPEESEGESHAGHEVPPPPHQTEGPAGGSVNVPEPVIVTERPPNPRRGWWHRLIQ